MSEVKARRRRPLRGVIAVALSGALLLAACGGDDSSDDEDRVETETTTADDAGGSGDAAASDSGQEFPDVVDVEVEQDGDTYSFAVTISSPYDSPERYADGWRVVGPDGTVYGEHELTHDHASEQPFTRTQSGVSIPEGVDEVTIEGRDLQNGFGGETVTVSVPTDDTDGETTVPGY